MRKTWTVLLSAALLITVATAAHGEEKTSGRVSLVLASGKKLEIAPPQNPAEEARLESILLAGTGKKPIRLADDAPDEGVGGKEEESPSAGDSHPALAVDLGPFTLRALENPGGGRIQDKRDPAPEDVVVVNGYAGRRVPLQIDAARAWQAMVKAARADGIGSNLLLPISGYRSYQSQLRLWNEAVRTYGSEKVAQAYVAKPGGSAHQSGRAIDLYLGGTNSPANIPNLRKLPAYKWLKANAHRFGFYPYEMEPWHWEYNPPA